MMLKIILVNIGAFNNTNALEIKARLRKTRPLLIVPFKKSL
jgi:hypothetical protein